MRHRNQLEFNVLNHKAVHAKLPRWRWRNSLHAP